MLLEGSGKISLYLKFIPGFQYAANIHLNILHNIFIDFIFPNTQTNAWKS